MSRPKLLDLFCGAGGCSVGYARAGFDVVGVDNRPQPRYPFTFIQDDAIGHIAEWWTRSRYDGVPFPYHAIHASPPCQFYSKTRKIMEGKGIANPRAVDLVARVREHLKDTGVPYVIENVPGHRSSTRFACAGPCSACE